MIKSRKKNRIIKKGTKKWKQNVKLSVALTVSDSFPEADLTGEDKSEDEADLIGEDESNDEDPRKADEDINLPNEEVMGGSFVEDQETQVGDLFLAPSEHYKLRCLLVRRCTVFIFQL